MKTIVTLFFWAFSNALLFSQTTLQGKATDAETGEPIIFGTVALYKGKALVTGTETDFDGYYSLTEVVAGTYDVVFSYTGYQDYKVTDVVVADGKSNQLDAKISAGLQVTSCCCCWFRPLVSADETTQGFKFEAIEISRIAY